MIDVKRDCNINNNNIHETLYRIFRRHLNETKQKIIFKSMFFDLFEILKILIVKLYVDFEIERVKTRFRKKIHNLHKNLTRKI